MTGRGDAMQNEKRMIENFEIIQWEWALEKGRDSR